MSINEQPMNVYWSGQKSPTSNKYKINYKGTVATASALPATGNKKGDTYNISEDGSDYIWTGTEWDKFGANVYIGATSTANGIQGLVPPATTAQMYNFLTGMGTWQSAEDLGLALDDKVVHKIGIEAIAGEKTFTEDVNIKTDYEYNETLTDVQTRRINFVDKNGTNVAIIEHNAYSTNGRNLRFYLYKSGSSTSRKGMTFAVTANGDYSFSLPDANPLATNTHNLGAANLTWKNLYTETGEISASDERIKETVSSVDDDLLDAWADVSWVVFKFRDAVQAKGAGARLHAGVVAQQARQAMAAHGIDAARLGFFCHDEWTADEDAGVEAGDRYSIRYAEALAIEAAYQRRRAERAEARIKALEDRLEALEARLG